VHDRCAPTFSPFRNAIRLATSPDVRSSLSFPLCPRKPHPLRAAWTSTLPFALVVALAFSVGCRHNLPSAAVPPATADTDSRDEHSYAEPDRVLTRHVALELALDFERRVIEGTATLDLDWTPPRPTGETTLSLDTRDLSIRRAEASTDGRAWQAAPFELDPADPLLGRRLSIRLPFPAAKVRIHYATSPAASGLQWLTPEMTLGKRTPFLFSQSQPVHARSWVPLQDSPSVRFTYEARVTAPPNVRVLMSADSDPARPRNGDYHFRMPQPIPSYLLAIAAGDLVFQPLTPRTGIWAEPAILGRAVAEFGDTDRMVRAAERLYGAYRWGRYDLLILPPSFPYGGMENPRLTFVSPTIITGDRSLVSLIAHELAHSWSGNLVTPTSQRDMWLSEGFTTYVESRIVEELYGRERADMENITARGELQAEFGDANRPLQSLVLPRGRLTDPEGHLTGTIYTKGGWFLQFLEQRFGRAEFDAFLRRYFDHFAFRSISSRDFVDYARRNLLDRHPGRVSATEFAAWLHDPGVPDGAPRLTSPRLTAVDAARRAWLSDRTLPPTALTKSWLTQEWLYFLAGLPDKMESDPLKQLDAAYHFTGTPNAELANVWYPLTLRSGYRDARPAIAEYLGRVGRRRMVLSTYRALALTPEDLAFGRAILAEARPRLHPITVRAAEAALAGP
jgi:leukotriene-A4 hydrolase